MEKSINEKVLKILRGCVRDDAGILMIPDGHIEFSYRDDPDLDIIIKKSNKLMYLINEAEEKKDMEFLNRDLETDVLFLL